jgi:hypothetical protein
MTPLFRKMNLVGHNSLVVLNAPESFEAELASLSEIAIRRDAERCEKITFAIAFVQTLAAVEAAAETLLPRAEGDATVWFAYPKGTSRRYKCEFNRDTGWAAVQALGFDTVRQVAIDDDWSALRFRRVAFIGR